MLKDFTDIKNKLAEHPVKRRIGLVAAQDENSLDAIVVAANEGLVFPVLIGDRKKIEEILLKLGYPLEGTEIYDIPDEHESAVKAAEMARAGELDCIMKGKIETATLMKVMVKKETGIRTSNTMSAAGFMQSPYYHKIFAITDAGLMPYPTLEQKKDMIKSTVKAFHKLGVIEPKVSVLAAIEHVNPKMPETVDADALKKMAEEGEISGCIIEGPISYDLAMDKKAAEIKGYSSNVAGDSDILVVPDLVTGNSLLKALIHTSGALYAGAVLGAIVPLILTSRSASMEDKYNSIILNAYIGKQGAE